MGRGRQQREREGGGEKQRREKGSREGEREGEGGQKGGRDRGGERRGRETHTCKFHPTNISKLIFTPSLSQPVAFPG